MIRVAIDRQMWAEPRFATLQESMHWNRATTVGTVVLFWEATRALQGRLLRRADLLLALPGPPASKPAILQALLGAGYLRVEAGVYEVIDDASWFLLRAVKPRGPKARVEPAAGAPMEPAAQAGVLLMPTRKPGRRGRRPKQVALL